MKQLAASVAPGWRHGALVFPSETAKITSVWLKKGEMVLDSSHIFQNFNVFGFSTLYEAIQVIRVAPVAYGELLMQIKDELSGVHIALLEVVHLGVSVSSFTTF